MAADAPPDHMRIAGVWRRAITKRGSAIIRPAHFIDTWVSLHAFDT
jgi:hypothetical protein